MPVHVSFNSAYGVLCCVQKYACIRMQGFSLWPAGKILPYTNAAEVIPTSIVSGASFMLFKLPTGCLTTPKLPLNCVSTVPKLRSGVRERLQVEPHCQ